jgi:hypothetical protein
MAPSYSVYQPTPGVPSSAPGRTNTVLVAGVAGIVGVLIGLVSGVGLTVAVQSNETDQAASPTSDPETIPPSPTSDSETTPGDQPGESVSVFDLDTGDCILSLSVGEVSSIDLVDCGQPHDAEVFGTVELEDPEDAPYPGNEEIVTRVNDLCTDLFDDYVGVPPDESELTIDGIYPVEESWRFGDREGVCYAYDNDGPLTDSIEGSGR